MADHAFQLNRYADMTPYDQTIVRLDRDWSEYRKDQQPIGPLIIEMPAVYVNANYVKACYYDVLGRAEVAPETSLPQYIATQGPLTHTEADFLYMVHQQRSPVVIMLCNTEEGGNCKCSQYWPDVEGMPEERRSTTRAVTVTLQQALYSSSMVTRVLTVQPEGPFELWKFTQLHFLGWADHAVTDIDEFYQLLQKYREIRQENPLSEAFGPTVVHCSAGVGRTGTLICADMLLDQLHKNPARIDVFGTVLASRVFRRRLVQVKEQLRFLYEFIAYCIQNEGLAGNATGYFCVSGAVCESVAVRPTDSAVKAPTLTANPQTGALAQVRECTLPYRPMVSGPSVSQPPTLGPLSTVDVSPQAHAASTTNPPTNALAQVGEYSLPKRQLPSGYSLTQPSTQVVLPTAKRLPWTPVPPTANPPPVSVAKNEGCRLLESQLASGSAQPMQPNGRPFRPPRSLPPVGPTSYQVGVDAPNGRFVPPSQSRPSKSSSVMNLVLC
uniref:Receptor-type tyrosine-protein phosphatase F n=1 Tax=Schistocephalus solidus TaxID=70667 RepID=A0A0V0J939_SCHSO